MDKPTVIAGTILELVALIVIVRIWMRRPLRVVSSVFWSLVLLVPFIGLFHLLACSFISFCGMIRRQPMAKMFTMHLAVPAAMVEAVGIEHLDLFRVSLPRLLQV
jgi:hypothetical protein